MQIIYTYVRNDDPQWQASRQKTRETHYDPKKCNIDSNTNNRFRTTRDEFRYSLRSVEKYASWVEQIHVVVASKSQVPDWLNLDHPKINIVTHDQIFDKPERDLPTFNSQAIEVHIPKLIPEGEVALYMNDDIMFGAPVYPTDFVDPVTGKLSLFLDPCYSRVGKPVTSEGAFRSSWKNANRLLDSWFEKERRKKMSHAPSVISRNISDELRQKMRKELDITSASRFRQIDNYNWTCSVLPYYCLYTGRAFVNTDVVTCTTYITSTIESATNELQRLRDSKATIWCVEDSDDGSGEVEEADAIVTAFFEDMFPEKSSFEK